MYSGFCKNLTVREVTVVSENSLVSQYNKCEYCCIYAIPERNHDKKFEFLSTCSILLSLNSVKYALPQLTLFRSH